MPDAPSYKQSHGIPGVLKWAKKWQADAIIAQFDDDDEVELFRKNGIIALAQDFKSRFSVIPNITSEYKLTGQMAADFFLQKDSETLHFMVMRMLFGRRSAALGFRDRIIEKGFGDNFFE